MGDDRVSLHDFAAYQILGKPLFLYLGIATLISFIITATIILLSRTETYVTSVKWHHRLAIFSICLAFFHGVMAYIGLYWV
jgi:dolichyl-phosphate-mannose--protein O-mannosyl transferase